MGDSNENRIQYLLDRCMAGQETAEERAELNSCLVGDKSQDNLNEALLSSFFQLKDLVDMPVEKQDQILQAIHSLDKQTKIKKINYWKWAGVAAVFVGILLSVVLENKREPGEKEAIVQIKEVKADKIGEEIVANVKEQDDREPAKDVAILEMADGSRIELEQLDSGKTLENEGMVIERSAEGILLLRFSPNFPKGQDFASRIHAIRTPRGGTYKVVLPDRTLVHLNSSSRLLFPTSFGPNERRVSLEGEGYFDVAKDDNRQFVVETSKGQEKQDVVVYGTQFNINAYLENDGIITTLVEGSIKVRQDGSEQLLEPMQQAVTKDGLIQVSSASMDANLGWINNMFYFVDEPLANVMEQISRWYDIDISYVGKVPAVRLWGQISRTKKLSEMLEILHQTNDVRFEINGKEVVVMD